MAENTAIYDCWSVYGAVTPKRPRKALKTPLKHTEAKHPNKVLFSCLYTS